MLVFFFSQGKIEMEMELVSTEEAEERPAGEGREEPNLNPMLDPPKYVTFYV